VQHRASPSAGGRHRRTDARPCHAQTIDARFAVVTAAVVAGIGVAGVTAVTASATPAHVDAATHIALAPPVLSGTATGTLAPSIATIDRAEDKTARIRQGASAFARVGLKPRPVPLALWVNPLPEASVTSCFGQRWGHLHAGVDLAAPDGTPIRAAGSGVVVRAGQAQGYGNAVLIDHGDGFLTHYGHMSVITVTAGQVVTVGEQIGDEGSTGHSTGPHLHFEVHQGFYQNPIEPTRWMHDHGVDIPGCVSLTG
jgi:murein DD-endopeptidase MepM/ murein hydrolase activator NlpD